VTTEEPEAPGLRERKKQATREALSFAALRLALERGLDNVRVNAIAASAGVSPRTYNNYFSSREEAICALGDGRAQRVAEALRARPVDEPLADALVNAMVEGYFGDSELDRAALRLIASAAPLRGHYLAVTAAIEQPLAEAIAERTGADAEQDVYPRVLAAAVVSAARVAVGRWLRQGNDRPFTTVLRDALGWLAPAAAAIERAETPDRKETTC
jgi:AcrR family transcriptional regulator